MNELLRRILFLPPQASTFSTRIDELHYFVILTTMAAATLIFLAAIVFTVVYRRRPGQRTTVSYSSSKLAEGLIIGVPLSFFLLWFGLGFRDFVWLQSPPRDSFDVYVMGKQWMWKFAYPGGPSSTEVLTVPAGRKVRLLLTSRDVIHSFYVPAFRIKQDALPGRYTQTWFEATQVGRFPILCAEYCGTAHSEMRGEVVVLEPAAFDRWLEDQRRGALLAGQDASSAPRAGTFAEEGRIAAVRQECLSCHSVDGTRHIGPTWLDLFGRRQRLQDGKEVLADEGYLTRSMMDPLAELVAGYSPVMPTYQGRLSASEAAAIVEYIKTLQSGEVRPGPSEGPVYEPTRLP